MRSWFGRGTAVRSTETAVDATPGRRAQEDVPAAPNVLLLIGEFTSGGAEALVATLANRLSLDRWKVRLSARRDGPVSRRLGDPSGLTIVPKRWTVDPVHLLGLIRLIRGQGIDLVHAHLFGTNVYGFLAALAAGARIIQTVHGMSCLGSRKRIAAYRVMAPLVDRIVTVSDYLEQEMLARARIPKKKLCTIPNGIDPPPELSDAERSSLRAELGLESRLPIIGTIGNVKRVKGHDVLVQAAPSILRHYPNAVILVVGDTLEDPCYKSELDRSIERCNLTNAVKFLGYRPDARKILSLFDVFVLPSRSEGLSLALLEAMGCSRPIVATRVGGTTGVLGHGRTGLLVPPDDPNVLSRSVLRILDDPVLATALGTQAVATARRLYSTDTMVARYKKLYLEVSRGSR